MYKWGNGSSAAKKFDFFIKSTMEAPINCEALIEKLHYENERISIESWELLGDYSRNPQNFNEVLLEEIILENNRIVRANLALIEHLHLQAGDLPYG